LDLSEEETILATKKYHDDHEPKMDEGSSIIHAAMHAVIETQIAMIDPPQVHRTFTKLIDAGLDRHDAIHIVGSVLAEQLYHLMELQKSAQYNPYGRSLGELDIKKWKKHYSELKDTSDDQEDDVNETRGTVQIQAHEILALQDSDQPDAPQDREDDLQSEADPEEAEKYTSEKSTSSLGDLRLDLDSEAIMALNEEDELDEPENSVDDFKLDLDSEAIMAFDEEDAADETEDSLVLEADSEEAEDDASDKTEDGDDDPESEADPEETEEDTTDDEER
jgi:hypothetical protein